jgi:hypothetical protein
MPVRLDAVGAQELENGPQNQLSSLQTAIRCFFLNRPSAVRLL